MTVIEVRDLHKSYGEKAAVRGVSFGIEAGEVFCLLGPNGAGKTTTVEIIEGHRLASAGSVSVLGHDPGKGERALRDRIGVVLQEPSISQDLTVGELLEMHARWYSRSRAIEEVIGLVELEASRNTRAGTLSGGQQRRLDLALALIGDPDVLFLDEPTTGFDPHARRQAWTTIRSLCDLGKTVFLTTHYMDEAQHLADRVAVMVAGRIVAIGPPESIAGRDEQPTEIRFALPDGIGLADLPALAGATIGEDPAGVLVTTDDGVSTIHALTGWALERGLPLAQLSLSQPSLEDIYLALTADEPEEALR
ncbi:MAG TPA: ABC transporter ATP-binding protein [Gaiellales bacterium]|jgi:ABC-2 type transport system ATP-binding protein